ncbi:MAG: hypothetical protein U0836_14215 [Pirellulales bacterium]
MNHLAKLTLLGFLYVSACASPVKAAEFFGLGFTLAPEMGSSGVGLSSDGKIAVGQSGVLPEQATEAFRWTREGGIEGLGPPPDSSIGTSGSDAALDGTVVGISFLPQALEWTPDNVLHVLPNLAPPRPTSSMYANAYAISADAKWIVGSSWDSELHWTAVRWNADRQITSLPFTNAYDTSADGSVVIGTNSDSQRTVAVRWTESGGVQELGDLPGGRDVSTANGVSANGEVVVGLSSSSSSADYFEPFRWTAVTGMVGLGLLPGSVGGGMSGVSGNGEVIVGNNLYLSPTGDLQATAVIWTQDLGLLSAADYFSDDLGLASQLAGWHLDAATSVSRDGLVIVGHGTNPQGNHEAWMAIVPEPTSGMLAATGLVLAMACCVRRVDPRLRRHAVAVDP